MSALDISVLFPSPGVIRLQSRTLFGDVEGPECRRFLERVFQAEEISDVTIMGGDAPQAELRYCSRSFSLRNVAERVSAAIVEGSPGDGGPTLADGPDHSNPDGRACDTDPSSGSHHSGHDASPAVSTNLRVPPASIARDSQGAVRYYRYHTIVTGWQIKSELPGRLRVKNPVLFRKRPLCQAIERELMGVLGIDRFSTNSITCTVLVNYDTKQLNRAQVIEILDAALAGATQPATLDPLDVHLPICTASIPLAAYSQFMAPALLPAAALLYAYTSIPTLKEARRVFVEEKRIGVDALDAVVMVGCLGTMSIFPGAVCCWCLSFGRFLVKQSRDRSQQLMLSAFGKQPRYVWLCRDGIEVQVPAEKLEKGDVIAVYTGEVVPVDGHVVEGMAVIDQHALTGESTPAEKGVGDRVFASTLLVGGEIKVTVEMSGSETASAKIGRILSDTAGYKMVSQHKGERLADRAVLPTLGVGALGMATMGPIGAVAVLNSDLGTGIRMAAPLAMLSSLTLCASKGILVKDGRALEMMNQVDTVLFDKTGTLTRERPEVGRIIASAGWDSNQILAFAAAAERKFHHPIALAILHKAKELGLALPTTDETQYKVGYGISVQIGGRTVRVGSERFLHSEGIEISPEVRQALAEAHLEGHTMVMVAVDDRLGGALELRRGGPSRGPGDHPGPPRARDQAHRDHLGRPRGAYQEARRVAGHGPLFRAGPPRRQGRLRGEAPGGRLQGLLRRRWDQRLDRVEEGGCLDLPERCVIDRDRHGPNRVPGRGPVEALRPEGHRARPGSEREPELVDDPGAQPHERGRGVHDGVRDHDVGRHEQRVGPGRTGQRVAPPPQGRTGRSRSAARARSRLGRIGLQGSRPSGPAGDRPSRGAGRRSPPGSGRVGLNTSGPGR